MSFRKTAVAAICCLGLSVLAQAQEPKNIKFDYRHADIAKVVEDYAKASSQRFIIDPQVHGIITIINPGPVSLTEAFDQLSRALAINGLGISTQDGQMTIMQARALQRNSIPVLTEVPPAKPERMTTWIYQAKYVSADEVNKQLRILTSKDGELVPYTPTNQLLISDWSSNMQRIAAILKEIDKPMESFKTKK